MSAEPNLRHARPEDLPRLVAILNHYVLESHVTFDVEPFTLEQRAPWFEQFAAEGPHQLVVAERGDRVLGYATSTRLKPKAAYETSVETTVYVAPAWVGRGIGRPLLGDLLRRLEAEPTLHRAHAAIALPNPGSERLHRALGFTEIGTCTEVGFKKGRFVDVRWYERPL